MSDKHESHSLFLLDGMALVYRAFFAFQTNPIRNSKGQNTSAIFGVLNTLLEIFEKSSPTHIAVAFDTIQPTFRHEMYPEYKAQREEMPEELSASLPIIRRLLSAMSIPAVDLDGYEADDIIGTIAYQAAEMGLKVTMVTPDKDFAQLVTDNIILLRPGRKGGESEILNIQGVCEKWGIDKPEQIVDILGLWGDSSDNIPGVPGIGQKTASKLIKQFGSIQSILANLDSLKGKQKENLKTYSSQALLSRKLAEIVTDVPVNWSLSEFKKSDYKSEELKNMMIELEFNAIGKKIFGDTFKAGRGFQENESQGNLFESSEEGQEEPVQGAELKTIETTDHSYQVIDSVQKLEELTRSLKGKPYICFDTETSSLDPHETQLLGIAWSQSAHSGGYIVLPDDLKSQNQWMASLDNFFNIENVTWIGHNLKFDLIVLSKYNLSPAGSLFDTMIAHSLLEPDQRHGMDYLSESLLGYTPISITSLIGTDKKNQLSMKDVPIEQVSEYAAEDADITFQLFEILKDSLAQSKLQEVFYQIEMPLLPVLVDMEVQGVKIDVDALNEYSKNLGQSIESLTKDIYQKAGSEFNLNSPKQLGKILFEDLRIVEKPKKTKTGQYATNEQVLLSLSSTHSIVEDILSYRGLTKLKSTYVDTLPSHVKKTTGRIHTSFGQVMTATGRLQSHDPNLQNIPVRSAEGREIRRAFIPRDNKHLLVAADYSQIELRIIAAISGDEAMLQAFKDGIDIHAATASKVFSVSLDEVSAEMRRKAKMVNFGIAYGISAFGLAQRLGISRSEAKSIIDEYFIQFPGIRKYLDDIVAETKKKGHVETHCGRKRNLPDIHSGNATVRSAAERVAINTPIQGTAADMIKIAMAKVAKAIEDHGLKSKLIIQVHDELVFDALIEEVEQLSDLAKDCMESAISLNVPIVVDIGVGENWLQAH